MLLDAIGQFQTKVAPYDVREGFFQGGVVNAVLRSGTNTFQGTGFYTYSDEGLVGDKTKPYISNSTGNVPQRGFSSRHFGAELSGPIIADKLFFMVAAERVRADLPVTNGTTEVNSGNAVVGLDEATLARARRPTIRATARGRRAASSSPLATRTTGSSARSTPTSPTRSDWPLPASTRRICWSFRRPRATRRSGLAISPTPI
ncbi:hypothetical protein AB5I41_06425 [Sphingomonas sp. MMS24-JH45]